MGKAKDHSKELLRSFQEDAITAKERKFGIPEIHFQLLKGKRTIPTLEEFMSQPYARSPGTQSTTAVGGLGDSEMESSRDKINSTNRAMTDKHLRSVNLLRQKGSQSYMSKTLRERDIEALEAVAMEKEYQSSYRDGYYLTCGFKREDDEFTACHMDW